MRVRILSRICALTAIGWVALAASAAGAESTPWPQPLRSAGTVVWAGLDYSLVRMVGPGDFGDSEAIFPGMLEAWNSLFLGEMMQKTRAAIGKPLVPDTAGVMTRNQTATAKQIVSAVGPDDATAKTHITAEALAAEVRSLKLDSEQGVGLIFVMDRLVKPEQAGALYVVFFDVATRQILRSERRIYKAGGFGFRNYWFRVPKSAVADLKKMLN